jgi:hypothetical protein
MAEQKLQQNSMQIKRATGFERVALVREIVLKVVYLDEWQAYLRWFPMEVIQERMACSRNVVELIAWVMEHHAIEERGRDGNSMRLQRQRLSAVATPPPEIFDFSSEFYCVRQIRELD